MLNIRRFETGLQIVPNAVGNTAPTIEGEMAVWNTADGGDGNIWYNNGTTVYPITAAIDGLTGDVSATGPGIVHATVNFVGGVSAAAIAASVGATGSGTSLDTPNTLVLRDNTGSFAATNINLTGSLTGAVIGNASTATLAGNVTGLVSPFNGGTGISNANSSTITLANPFPITLTYPAATNVTLPVTGTLATLAGVETFSNKTFSTAQTWNEVTTPGTNPPAGSVDIYAKSDNNIYVLNSAGLESPINGGASPVGSITMFSGTVVNSYTGTFSTSSVTITANSANSGTITLTGDGTSSLNTLISNFNTANPYNTITLTSGDGTQVPTSGAMATLTGSKLPPGWLVCDGSAQSKITYAALYSVISANYGVGLPATQSVATLMTTPDVSTAAFANIGTNTITADNLGLIGNSIVLTFDGTSTIDAVIGVWNTANPSNQVTQVGNGSNVYPAQSLQLSNGASTVDGKYFKIYDDTGLVVPWVKIASTTTQPTVAGATRYIQINGIVVNATSTQVATAIAASLSADSQFTPTTSTGNTVTIINTSYISHPAGNDGNSPFAYAQTNTGGFSTFNLPDFRGMFPRGTDPTGINDPDYTYRTSANSGNTGGKVGSIQADGMSDHTHSITFRAGAGATTPEAPGGGGTYNYNSNGMSSVSGITNITTESRPKNVYVNFIIKF
jgi:microcystin-dependent protein